MADDRERNERACAFLHRVTTGIPGFPAGAHESPEATLAAVETDAIRLRAVALVARYDAHMSTDLTDLDRPERMDAVAWQTWEGQAYTVLREVARG